jgi:FAD/FMN-containing dehydrogenase
MMSTPIQVFSYFGQRQSYWAAQQREVCPACFVKPTTSQEVGTAVKVLAQNQCQFAIRSGGHSANTEFNIIERGVTIDLSDFKGIEIASDGTYANIKPGNRW